MAYYIFMFKILFVCTGNICRSPTAEGVLRQRLEQLRILQHFHVDSAGTHGYHIGEAPDTRSIRAAQKRGIAIDGLRARKIAADDFHAFDLILACDRGHLEILRNTAPKGCKARVELFLDFVQMDVKEVPDPYYGGSTDFEYVLDLVESGADKLIAKLDAERKAS